MNLNILKMNPVEKRLLLGGLVGSLAFWANKSLEDFVPEYPTELKQHLDPHLPTNADIIATVTPPAIFYVANRVSKTTDTKEKMGDLGFGSSLYCLPKLMHRTVVESALTEGVKARPLARAVAPITKYAVTPTPARPALPQSMSKYIVTA